MGHIFISYSHKDRKYVEKLEQKLIEEGFDVWIDHRIDYGTEWPRVIQDALDACDAFIVVVSENAYRSKWVQNEVARAGRKGKPFFPLLLQGDPWLSVEAMQYVDVKDSSLPPEKYYDHLERVTPRRKSEGRRLIPRQNLVQPAQIKKLFQSLAVRVVLIAIVLVIVISGVAFGRNFIMREFYLFQAQMIKLQAVNLTEPTAERDSWQMVLDKLEEAEYYGETSETQALGQEVQSNLDILQGIQRLNFYPAFVGGVNVQISRLAANETDLYMLDAERGRVLHANLVGRNFEIDEAFRCEPGQYGDYQVGPIVDILILPRLNSLDAAVLGIDAGGNLLYCSPSEVRQAIPLPVPDSNWGRVTGFTYDSGSLYVLDAPSRAIWVYPGKDASFIDRPYFFFDGQIPEIEDAIDLVVNGDDLFMLHADGHLSTCSYSRLEAVPTRCQDPAPLTHSLPAYQDINLFAQAHITQMQIILPPDSNLLLLDADNRGVLRISSRTLELQNQIYPIEGEVLNAGPAGAMTVNPNRVLFLAVDDQVYFTTDMP